MKWLSFRKRCQFRLPCLTHKTLFLGRPRNVRNVRMVDLQLHTYMDCSLIAPINNRHLLSSDATLLDLPVTLNVMRSSSLSSMAPTVWHFLPYRLRKLKSPHVFSNGLKDYLNVKLK